MAKEFSPRRELRVAPSDHLAKVVKTLDGIMSDDEPIHTYNRPVVLHTGEDATVFQAKRIFSREPVEEDAVVIDAITRVNRGKERTDIRETWDIQKMPDGSYIGERFIDVYPAIPGVKPPAADDDEITARRRLQKNVGYNQITEADCEVMIDRLASTALLKQSVGNKGR